MKKHSYVIFASSLAASVTRIDEGDFGFCGSLPPDVRADIEKRFGSDVFTW
jgi:hypothetical protein